MEEQSSKILTLAPSVSAVRAIVNYQSRNRQRTSERADAEDCTLPLTLRPSNGAQHIHCIMAVSPTLRPAVTEPS